jgi:hypothetical protein
MSQIQSRYRTGISGFGWPVPVLVPKKIYTHTLSTGIVPTKDTSAKRGPPALFGL